MSRIGDTVKSSYVISMGSVLPNLLEEDSQDKEDFGLDEATQLPTMEDWFEKTKSKIKPPPVTRDVYEPGFQTQGKTLH